MATGKTELERPDRAAEIRRAFISAPASTDTSVLRAALEERGITPYELDEANGEGQSLLEIVQGCVDQADLVIFVLGPNEENNVLVELGYALGLKKRVLLLIGPKDDPPLGAGPYLRAAATNREAIAFGLDRILAAKPFRAVNGGAPKTKPLGDHADELLQTIRAAGDSLREDALTEIIVKALHACGVSAVERAGDSTRDKGADLVIWSDDFGPWIDNPLPIELTTKVRTPGQLKQALDQISGAAASAGIRWSLLLLNDSTVDRAGVAKNYPHVLILTAEELLESLRSKSLGRVLHELRNARVHGKG